MRPIHPCLLKDFYKVGHKFQYPKGTTLVYSNLTPRGTRRDPKPEGIVAYGFQYFVIEYLINQFRENFFERSRDKVVAEYKRRVDCALGPGTDVSHIGELHELGYLPLRVKAVPEGTLVPYRVPAFTICNTVPEFFWLTNMLESILSNVLWIASTSATTAFGYRKVFEQYARETGADPAFVPWQGHDFSFRGMAGLEAACISGAAHLLSFTGTDTIPAIDFLELYYGADAEKELIGGSVPATEHSVMCMGSKGGEFETFKRLLTEVYPNGILSVVSDTWNLWDVIWTILPRLKREIMARNGKLVIRPDSGDPVKILLGDPDANDGRAKLGVIRGLSYYFGSKPNAKGFLELDPHVGTIYGDSITPERQKAILQGLKDMGYASSNVVLGIGSYTYQHVTRDTDGWAMKATYGERNGAGVPIFKDPITDNGLKKSAYGLLKVEEEDGFKYQGEGKWPAHTKTLKCVEDVDWNAEREGVLETVFLDGELKRFETLAQIRQRVQGYLG